MAYRAPRFCWVHAARTVGASAITVSDTAHADYPKANLVDDRASTLFKWSASVTDPTIDINLGANYDTGINRLIIPYNHNIEQLSIQEADNASFTLATTLLAATTSPVAGEQIDLTFADSTERYIRITIVGSDQYYLPQLVLTKVVTLTVGPDLSRSVDGYRSNTTRLEQNTGISPTVQHGPDQRVLEYIYEFGLSGDDLTNMEAMIAGVGMRKPLWVDPASFSATPATDDPPLWMKFDTPPQSLLFVNVASTGVKAKTYRLQLIESLD